MQKFVTKLLEIELPSSTSSTVPSADWSASQVQRHVANLLVTKLCQSADDATEVAAQWGGGSGQELLDASPERLQSLFGVDVGDCLFKMVRNESCARRPWLTTAAWACEGTR
ncbi:hypothetical protein MY11210_009042 [Beauveria gryllotalpidicola]